MGCTQSKHRSKFDIVVINEILKEKQYEYLQPKGKIHCLRDLDFNVLILDIEGWLPTQARVWTAEHFPQKHTNNLATVFSL